MFSRPQNNCRDCSEWLSQAWKWLISKGLQTKRKPDWSNRRRTLRKMVYAANMLFDQMRCSLVTKTLLMLTHPKGHHPCSQTSCCFSVSGTGNLVKEGRNHEEGYVKMIKHNSSSQQQNWTCVIVLSSNTTAKPNSALCEELLLEDQNKY